MTRRIGVLVLVGIAIQGAAFAWVYGDLIYLRRPVATLVRSGPDPFVRHATRALERPRLTRGHLETIAQVAQTFRLAHLEVTALERHAAMDPRDRRIALRFAEALRRQGDMVRAERIYRNLAEAKP